MEKKRFYVICPECGRRLCRANPGAMVEMECPKCTEQLLITVDGECDISIRRIPPPKPVVNKKPAPQVRVL